MHETIDKPKTSRATKVTWAAIGGVLLILLIVGLINEATAEQASLVTQQSFPILMVMAFLGGVLSFLSPCTLPILPAYFAFATQSGRRQVAVNTLSFVLGLATVFSFFGATASALGSVMRDSRYLILTIGGSLILVFGVMSLLGRGFTGFQQKETGGTPAVEGTGLGGSFLFGMTFAVGWSSCIGPILGVMMSMAATTASLTRGTILLFIFALGLGLPLILVSTLFGRSSRNSLFWRVLRGKGWMVKVPELIIALLWAVTAWVILWGGIDYLYTRTDLFPAASVSSIQLWGLLGLTTAGALLWNYTIGGGNQRRMLHLHTTSLFSGFLFVLMGYFMLSGQMTQITAWATAVAQEQEWYFMTEEWIFDLLN